MSEHIINRFYNKLNYKKIAINTSKSEYIFLIIRTKMDSFISYIKNNNSEFEF